MTTAEGNQALMVTEDEETGIQVQQVSAIAAITKSEVESQLDAAHRYPRTIKRFIDDAMAMVCRSVDVASSCFYTLPPRRGGDGKSITGPSVRLAEIAASAYRNLHVGARPIEIGPQDTVCAAQGVVWDLERNVRVTVEKTRRITTREGRRFSEDMQIVTQNAAASIALRDAIFRVIPRAYIDELDQAARKVAVGDAKTLADRRSKAFAHFAQMGATRERVLAAIGKPEIEAVTMEDMETLIGYASSIKDGHTTVDEAFPAIVTPAATTAPEDQGRRLKLGNEPKPRVTVDTSQVKEPADPGSEG